MEEEQSFCIGTIEEGSTSTSTITEKEEDSRKRYTFDFYPLSKLKQKQKIQLCCLCFMINILVVMVFVLGILYNGRLEELHELQKSCSEKNVVLKLSNTTVDS